MEQDAARFRSGRSPLALSASSLQVESVATQRSFSQDIREERDELREAADQSLNVIVDVNLDGTIRWTSPSWTEVIGTDGSEQIGKPFSDLIVSDNKTVFVDAVESMKKDDSRSYRLHFAMNLGPFSRIARPPPTPTIQTTFASEEGDYTDDEETRPKEEELLSKPEEVTPIIDLEAQGIIVYDSASGGESHTMWMIRPWKAPREVKIDIPSVIVQSLGSGAEVLATYLTQLAESGSPDPESHPPPPPPLLCRICERHIPAWWFEKHTDLCLQEHRAEMDVQMAQDALSEHRHAIVRVLDALEARKSRPMTVDQSTPMAEYKNLPIGPPPSNHSSPSASTASRERSAFGHARARSFAVRRPQARIVELLLDLCDTALEVSTPAIKESSQSQNPLDFRTQSPQTESLISQVLQWQSPSTNTLEQEQGLALLCADTERAAKEKMDAILRHRKIIEYAERIRIEFSVLVQDCIDDAIQKASRIAAGCLSDSGDDTDGIESTSGMNEEYFPQNSYDPSSELVAALQKASEDSESQTRPMSYVESVTSFDSPRECPTPVSNVGGMMVAPSVRESQRTSRRESMIFGSEAGDSDMSVRSSSVASRMPLRTESPISEFGDLRRAANVNHHQRRSLVLPGTISPHRQESPSRAPLQPASPLRIKARSFPYAQESIVSPEQSPMLPGSDFSSPAPLSVHHTSHHRRQSSAAMSEFVMKPPPSPRLGAHNPPPQARPSQTSIKDFEIIKPISKGAFGSVYLSKKKTTAEYFAIKVLKKADMVAKNQVSNVKAERAIMMWQGQSDFVAKLYWTFSSKDYLYLVMEYLNGGDCASLIKILGGLPEDWCQKYLGEVILGVDHLHSRGIIHRDLKPDNLLIDQKGHLKLTDFGLSRMGLVGRQKRAIKNGGTEAPDILKQGPFARSSSMASSRSASIDMQLPGAAHSPYATPLTTPDTGSVLGQPSAFSLGPSSTSATETRKTMSGRRSDSGSSETLSQMLTHLSMNEGDSSTVSVSGGARSIEESSDAGFTDGPMSPSLGHRQSSSHIDPDPLKLSSASMGQSNMIPPAMALFDPDADDNSNRRFVGTPDYLAPETVRGEKQNETSDWWSVGCIMFEFLYGIPPFHDNEPELVFENILARRINWPDESEEEFTSSEAKDLINKLLCMDPDERLGANNQEKFATGGEEIRSHAWFRDINFDTLLEDEAQFVPQIEHPEDTEYFDSRGATLQSFQEEVEDNVSGPSSTSGSDYHDRPHDALSRVRNSTNTSNKRGMIPLSIPPHIRDTKSRRLSEPPNNDDFGSFAFKNLPALDKANKAVIQKLRAETAQNKPTLSMNINPMPSPGPSVECSPILPGPLQRTLSSAKSSTRPQSPSTYSITNSPSRTSQPLSPLLMSFVSGQNNDSRRKVSAASSSLSQQSSVSQPTTLFDTPKSISPMPKTSSSLAATPVKPRVTAPPPLALSPSKGLTTPRPGSATAPPTTRSRSRTVGSQSNDGSPVADPLVNHRNRHSQVFDMSPSSSDTEGDKHTAYLNVQRRRQNSRRFSQIALDGGPLFRPLDVLIGEDHPVARMVMEKLLEKLRCRTVAVSTGSEAVRYATGEIKFDIIFLEFKLPQINGTDVARMIRETKNANAHTPIVAITAYLKELPAPHYFDSLIEKPISSSKLADVMRNMCYWKPASSNVSVQIPHPVPSVIRLSNLRPDGSPTSSVAGFPGRTTSSLVPSSREDSISSVCGDSESVTTDDFSVNNGGKKPTTSDADDVGLGIGVGVGVGGREDEFGDGSVGINQIPPIPPLPPQYQPTLQSQNRLGPSSIGSDSSSSSRVEMGSLFTRKSLKPHPRSNFMVDKRGGSSGTESADDEDEELGSLREKHLRPRPALPSSKLGIEMMRASSHDSITLPQDISPTTTPSPCSPLTTPVKDATASNISALSIGGRTGLENAVAVKSPLSASESHTPPESLSVKSSSEDLAEEKTPRPEKQHQAQVLVQLPIHLPIDFQAQLQGSTLSEAGDRLPVGAEDRGLAEAGDKIPAGAEDKSPARAEESQTQQESSSGDDVSLGKI